MQRRYQGQRYKCTGAMLGPFSFPCADPMALTKTVDLWRRTDHRRKFDLLVLANWFSIIKILLPSRSGSTMMNKEQIFSFLKYLTQDGHSRGRIYGDNFPNPYIRSADKNI